MIYYNGKELNGFKISTDKKPSSETAMKILDTYIVKACGHNAKNEGIFFLRVDDGKDDDSFSIDGDFSGITVSGGKRGVIYGVYEFLERYAGFGFFANDCIVIPDKDVYITDVHYPSTSVFKYREILGNSAGYNADSFLRYRLNSNFWFNVLKEEHGGGYKMAGIPAHSLTGDFLLRPYVQTNPEFFSLVDGKRMTDAKGQICFSSREAVECVKNEVIKLLENNPTANYISISAGDNSNYCQCEECKKKYKEHTVSELFYGIVNEVAKTVKERFPKVLVHTFYYLDINDITSEIKFEDNVFVQFCSSACKNHQLQNESCAINKEMVGRYRKYAEVFKKIIIWDYPNCFKYEMICLPDFYKIKKDMEFYASNNAYGFFCEYNHREEDNSCVFNEWKTYLLSKLLWNPFISDTEYEKLINNFGLSYYGTGYTYLLDYIKLWETSINKNLHFNYDLTDFSTHEPAFNLIEKDKIPEFVKKAGELWDNCEKYADSIQLSRIKKDRLQFDYLELLLTFDDIMENGNDEEKAIALEKNKKLIDSIKKYNVKLTFWGQSVEDQNKEIDKYYKTSPRRWNYKW